MATTITANGINFPDGSAGSPSIGGTDTNTGLFTGSDIIGFSTGGSERLRVDSSGRLLVGTTTEGHSDADNLTIADSANSGITIRSGTNNSGHIYFSDGTSGADEYKGIIVYEQSSNYMGFWTNGDSEKLRIDSSGVTIKGATNAAARLLLQNTTSVRTNYIGLSGDDDRIVIAADDADQGSNSTIDFKVDGSERMRIDSSGNVGIGNDASFPVYTHVSSRNFMLGTGSESTALQLHSSSTTYGGIYFGDVADRTDANSYIGSIQYKHGDDYMDFRTNSAERMRIDSSGNVGIGTDSPDSILHCAFDSGTTGPTSGTTPKGIAQSYGGTDNHWAGLWFSADFGGDQGISGIAGTRSSGYNTDLRFYTNDTGSARAFTERMRITPDGYVGIGTTNPARHLEIMDWSASGSSTGLEIGDVGIRSSKTGSSTVSHIRFYNSNGQVGSIHTASSATSFNTSSDYRLKENVVSISDGITRIKQLKPSKFNWISDETNTPVDGFLAHEVSSIVPEAITGTKDAIAVQKDVDDAIAEEVGDPIYQTIDQSKLVPLLVAALQETIGRIEALEAK